MRILTPRETMAELCSVLSWSEEARLAYARALASYQRAGCPGIPLGARDYQAEHRRLRRQERRQEGLLDGT